MKPQLNKLADSPFPESAPIKCLDCRDTGYLEVPQTDGGIKIQYCQCALARIAATRVPPLFEKASLGDFGDMTQAAVRAWLRKPVPGFFITGPPGTGKTHLACAIVRDLTLRGKEILFKRFATLCLSLRTAYSEHESEYDVLRDYYKTPWLILDDLGAGSLSDHERRTTLEVLDQRIDNRRPTVVTTNLLLDKLEEWDARIGSRLSSFALISREGPDRRIPT
jgi:chromosomal replication initiation ATPase DnaA